MPTRQEELRNRTKAFAVRIVKVYRSLPSKQEAQVLGRQLLRSGTAVAANYRAASRARSRAEWIAKLGIVVEEADGIGLLIRDAARLRDRASREVGTVAYGSA